MSEKTENWEGIDHVDEIDRYESLFDAPLDKNNSIDILGYRFYKKSVLNQSINYYQTILLAAYIHELTDAIEKGESDFAVSGRMATFVEKFARTALFLDDEEFDKLINDCGNLNDDDELLSSDVTTKRLEQVQEDVLSSEGRETIKREMEVVSGFASKYNCFQERLKPYRAARQFFINELCKSENKQVRMVTYLGFTGELEYEICRKVVDAFADWAQSEDYVGIVLFDQFLSGPRIEAEIFNGKQVSMPLRREMIACSLAKCYITEVLSKGLKSSEVFSLYAQAYFELSRMTVGIGQFSSNGLMYCGSKYMGEVPCMTDEEWENYAAEEKNDAAEEWSAQSENKHWGNIVMWSPLNEKIAEQFKEHMRTAKALFVKDKVDSSKQNTEHKESQGCLGILLLSFTLIATFLYSSFSLLNVT